MRIFVYEWTCCVEDAPSSLRREGWAMLQAVLQDFGREPRVTTVTLVHESFQSPVPGEVRRIRSAAEEASAFKAIASSADVTMVVAPETDRILDCRCRWVEEAGGWLLGPSEEARRLTASKAQMGKCWTAAGIPTPEILAVGEAIQLMREFPIVLKPDDGAGSQATFLVRNAQELQSSLARAQAQFDMQRLVAQRYVRGRAVSASILVGPHQIVPLPPGEQRLSEDDRFQYEGGAVPLAQPLYSRAALLAWRAIYPCRGLLGYTGVDLVLGEASDGSGDFAMEINPRLTTSYLGLRQLTKSNLAWAMLQAAKGWNVGGLRWEAGPVHFRADGTLATWAASP